MRQSNIIFGTLIFSFVIYITIRDQLPEYLNLFSRKESQVGAKGSDYATPEVNDELKDIFDKARNMRDGLSKFDNMGLNNGGLGI